MDLLLGSDIGRWVASIVDPRTVRVVVTQDADIARTASRRGMSVVGMPLDGGRALSVHYPTILDPKALHQYAQVWNLHPGLLPWGRGHFPLVWSIWLHEPAGATLHRMVEKVDAGPIVDQIRVPLRLSETGDSLHRRIRAAERRLFKKWWTVLLTDSPIPERPQAGRGSYHDRKAFARLLNTDPDRLSEEDAARLRRALTFTGKPGLRPSRRNSTA